MDKDPPEFRNRLAGISEILGLHAYSTSCDCTRCRSVRKGVEEAMYKLQGNVVKLQTPGQVIRVDFKSRKVVR